MGGLGYSLLACASVSGSEKDGCGQSVEEEEGASHVTNTFNGGKERQAAARGKLSIGNLSISHASQIAEPIRMGKQSECVSCLCDEVSRR